jgi:hypothetical protein
MDWYLPNLPEADWYFLREFRERHEMTQGQMVTMALRLVKQLEEKSPEACARLVEEIKWQYPIPASEQRAERSHHCGSALA